MTGARRLLWLSSLDGDAPADVVTFEVDLREDPDGLAHPRAIVLGGRCMA